MRGHLHGSGSDSTLGLAIATGTQRENKTFTKRDSFLLHTFLQLTSSEKIRTAAEARFR